MSRFGLQHLGWQTFKFAHARWSEEDGDQRAAAFGYYLLLSLLPLALLIVGDDLGKLPFAIGLSRASQRIIRQNMVIALGVIALLVIASLVGVIPLSVAVLLHEGSTIVVVLNALRLLAWRERPA